jgi:hypothetical protein
MDQKQHRTHKPNELLDVRTREILIELDQGHELVVGLPVDVMITPKAKPNPTRGRQPSGEKPKPQHPTESPSEPPVKSTPLTQGTNRPSTRGPNVLQPQIQQVGAPVDPVMGLGTNRHESPRINR